MEDPVFGDVEVVVGNSDEGAGDILIDSLRVQPEDAVPVEKKGGVLS